MPTRDALDPSTAPVDLRPARSAGVVGALITALIVAVFVLTGASIGEAEGDTYIDDFPTEGALNVMLAQGDGQAYVAVSEDPTLSRPERFGGPAGDVAPGAEMAYWAQRPVMPYAAWLLSAGQSAATPAAMIVLAVVGGGLTTSGTAALLAQRGYRRPQRAVVVIVFPGAIMSLSWLGPDLLALGLALWGLYFFERRRLAIAVGLFATAALTREVTLLVPAALALHSLVVDRSLRRALLISLPATAFVAWLLVLHQRLGYFPWDAGAARLAPPWSGVAQAADGWGIGDLVLSLANYLLVIIVVRRPRDPLSWIIGVVLLFSLMLGSNVWAQWRHVGRVFLMAQVLAFVMLLTWSKVAAASSSRPASRSVEGSRAT